MGEHAAAPTHTPVLFSAVMEGLAVRDSGVYLDGTFGRGGHARGVLERLGAEGRLLVMDKDPAAIAEAVTRDPPLDLTVKTPADAETWAEALEAKVLSTGTLRTSR